MDRAVAEFVVVEEPVALAVSDRIRELNELQLALVGGGYGDTVI